MFYRCYNNVLSYIGDAMSDLRKAAEMALEFVEWFASDDHSVRPQHKAPEVVEALRQALAQPEQEPVGYVTIETISSWAKVPSIKWFKKPTQGPLYTAPPKREWVGMTDEEVESWRGNYDFFDSALVREVEAKLKEKNSV
jgi:hypothetical protein